MMGTCRAGDGTKLFYVVDGDGPRAPLILLHGLFCSYRMFDRLAGRVGDRKLIRPDIRGHGRSDRPHDPDRYRWKTLSDDVVDVLDDLGIEQAVVGGLSLGANIALSVAEHHLDRCAGLIIEMPVLTRGREAALKLFPRLANGFRMLQPLLDRPTRFVRGRPPVECQPELGLLKDILGVDIASMTALEEGLLRSGEPFPAHDGDTLGRIKVPTLVIAHHHDGLHAFEDSHDTVERIAGAELIETNTIADLRIQQGRYANIMNGWLEYRDL